MNNEQKSQNTNVSQHSSNEMLSAAFPVRVQRKRAKGWKMPKNTVSVTRPGKWGNPFKVGEAIWNPRSETISLITPKDINECVELFKVYIKNGLKKNHTWVYRDIHELKGKNLACFCSVLDKNGNYVHCHADYLLSLANNLTLQEIKDENIKAELRKKP